MKNYSAAAIYLSLSALVDSFYDGPNPWNYPVKCSYVHFNKVCHIITKNGLLEQQFEGLLRFFLNTLCS